MADKQITIKSNKPNRFKNVITIIVTDIIKFIYSAIEIFVGICLIGLPITIIAEVSCIMNGMGFLILHILVLIGICTGLLMLINTYIESVQNRMK